MRNRGLFYQGNKFTGTRTLRSKKRKEAGPREQPLIMLPQTDTHITGDLPANGYFSFRSLKKLREISCAWVQHALTRLLSQPRRLDRTVSSTKTNDYVQWIEKEKTKGKWNLSSQIK